jgi:hypothetical protein
MYLKAHLHERVILCPAGVVWHHLTQLELLLTLVAWYHATRHEPHFHCLCKQSLKGHLH